MKKLKVMTIVGTRPELIRLSEIIKKADKYFEHVFVHTGQNYDDRLNEIFYEDLGIRKPDFYLGVVGEHLGETLGNIIAKSYEVMRKEKPDALLILGDTNSALTAISAKRLKIPSLYGTRQEVSDCRGCKEGACVCDRITYEGDYLRP